MEPQNDEREADAEVASLQSQKIAERYARMFPTHREDLMSSANIAAAHALDSWKRDKYSLEDWTRTCMRWEVKRFLCLAAARREFPADMKAFDVAATPKGRQGFEELLSVLPEKFRKLMVLIYEEGKTPASAGAELGYTPRHGCRLHTQALAILRRKVA